MLCILVVHILQSLEYQLNQTQKLADMYREQVIQLEDAHARVREEGDIGKELFKVAYSLRFHVYIFKAYIWLHWNMKIVTFFSLEKSFVYSVDWGLIVIKQIFILKVNFYNVSNINLHISIMKIFEVLVDQYFSQSHNTQCDAIGLYVTLHLVGTVWLYL